MNRLQQMAYVQSRVTSNIRWVSDATEWGQHDYWATATQTLAHGAGDEEDRAIVKLQALKALGFNQSDLFLTLAQTDSGLSCFLATGWLPDGALLLMTAVVLFSQA